MEKSTCELKLELAATRSALDDAEFAKKQLQKHPSPRSPPNTGGSAANRSPSIASLGSFMGFK